MKVVFAQQDEPDKLPVTVVIVKLLFCCIWYVESVAVEEGMRIFLELNAKAGSELAKSLADDIRDAFEGLDIELNLKFKE